MVSDRTCSSERSGQQPLAAIRSSIRSRSTSQYLSAESKSLSIPSASVETLASGISCRHCAEDLLDLCRLRFAFAIRHRPRRRPASINIPPYESFPAGVSHHGTGTVVPIVRRLALRFLLGLNSRITQAIRRIFMTATRNLKARREALDRISDCGRYAALTRTLSGTGATRRPCSPSQLVDAGQQGIVHRTRAGLPRQ